MISEKIDRWKEYPNCLGSEASAASLVGEISARLNEEIPFEVKEAMRALSLRGTMRDIASAIQKDEEHRPRLGTPSFHDVVDSGAASCGISWGEAIAVIVRYFEESRNRICEQGSGGNG
jgi:class 3 adenylate cyclase